MNVFYKQAFDSKYVHTDILKELLVNIYNYKIQGKHMQLVDVFHNNKSKIIMTKVTSPKNLAENIKIFLIELNFLNSINSKIFVKNFFTYCVECGEIHAQHKYKNCGHSVNFFCAYNKINKSNCCSQCGKNIIKEDINLITTNDQQECPICLENCNTKLKSCGHYFHKTCIKTYYNSNLCGPNKIEKNNSCPMCRNKIVETKSKITKFKNTKFCIDKKREGIADILIQII